MDAKEVKIALKGIKESLDAKDFKSAIKQCKAVLKSDRNNYVALVFFGVALQETEQRDEAPKAFKKAIEIKPESNLAWRGLASFYERFDSTEARSELLKAYERLLVLETESNKYGEFVRKYESLAVAQRDDVVSKRLYAELNELGDEKRALLKHSLLAVFRACSESDPDVRKCKKELLEEYASSKSDSDGHLAVCREYLELLSREGNPLCVISQGMKMLETSYPRDPVVLERVCEAYADVACFSIEDGSLVPDCREAYLTLLDMAPESDLGLLCRGIDDYRGGDPLLAMDSLKRSARENPANGLTWFVLCKCQTLLYQFADSETSAQEALKCFQNVSKYGKLASACELCLIRSLSEQGTDAKWTEAAKLGKELCERDERALPLLVKALVNLNRIADAETYLEAAETNESTRYLRCLVLKRTGNASRFKESLEELVREHPESLDGWLDLGRVHYEDGNAASALACLLRAAKSNQLCYLGFLYLGHCYKNLVGDSEKARRCYQKAFQLNPESTETGISLSETYRILNKENLNSQLLNLVVTQKPKLKWGWLNLGIHYLSMHNYQSAVNSLRVATRLDPDDMQAWEILADAYFYQGAYVSSGKAYGRVIALGSDSMYPLLQSAIVRHHNGQHDASMKGFREVIEKYPDYLPALKSHAEVCISLMKQCLSQNLVGLAMDKCQEAANSIIKCLETRRDLSCIWKLMGDACVLLSHLPEKYCKLTVSSKLVAERKLREGHKEVVLNKLDILKLGSRSYCEAISLNAASSGLWYDLGVCYDSMATHGASPDERRKMRELACSAIKKSLLVNESNWESWNLFGVLCASDEIKDYPLAQHCFIRALDENKTSPVVWTNLGTLYLCLHDLKLANQSFTEAQRLDPDYVQCWIGQAMIAHSTGHHDAMDLFRHSNLLGVHPEGSLGYANLVCQTLLETKDKNDKNYIYSIKNMNAVAVACDALTWYTDRIVDNPCAFNMLGLLLERQRLFGQACDAFERCVSLLIANATSETGRGEEDAEVLDKALLNYGRCLKSVGRHEDAVSVLKQIRRANFTNQCALAEAYFKAGKFEDAYSSYETTLEWLAPDSGFKSHILVAMAAVVYMHQGKDDAKILLMQASQLKPPSVQGLFACCALGMLHSDLSLSELSLKELSQYRDDPRYLSHIAVFESYIYLFKGEKQTAIRVLSKAIHRHPEQPSLWLSLSLLLLHLYPSFDSQIAANCAEITINIGRSAIDVSKVMSLVSLSDLLSGKGLKSLRSSQKAVHMFPHETENWVVLVASVLSRCLARETPREIMWLKKTISYIRRKFEGSKAMTLWLSNNERKVTVMAEALAR